MTRLLRPLLAPGAPLLRRDRTTAQIGLNPGTIVPLRPGVYEILRLLDGVRTPDRLQTLVLAEVPEFVGHVLDVLGPLIHAGAVLPHRPSRMRLPTWTVEHDPVSRDFAELVRLGVDAHPPTDFADPELRILVSAGEPHRLVPETLVSTQQAHVLVVLDGRTVHLGPLVVPGSTPCLDCYDHHRAALDPHWRVFVPQFGTRRLENAVETAVQFRAVAALCRGLVSETPHESLIGQRLTIDPRLPEPRQERFGFANSCHCHLLAA